VVDAPQNVVIACRKQEMPMIDSPAYLSAEALARVRAPESSDWSMITVEPADFAAKEDEFLGVAILDERCRSDIHNGRSTVFRLEAGEHTVSVHIKRRFRVDAYRGRAMVSLPVVVKPGEHLELVFGVAKEWRPLQEARILWPVLLLQASLGIAFGVGWLAFPVVREAVAWATASLGIRQPWLSWSIFFVSSRTKTAFLTAFAWMLGATVSFSRHFPKRRREVGGPYYLAPRIDFRKPSPQLKSQYVDPFE
jgi:hypothetical protein